MDEARLKPVKLALIDDNEDYLFAVGTFLTRNGYTIVTANNGREGLDLIRRERPDLILLDVMMESSYAGFEVWRQLQSDPALAEVPIIGISAMQSELGVKPDGNADREYFNPAAFLDKPVDYALLRKTIEEVLAATEKRRNMPGWKKAMEQMAPRT